MKNIQYTDLETRINILYDFVYNPKKLKDQYVYKYIEKKKN